jgi:hypothetical protein
MGSLREANFTKDLTPTENLSLVSYTAEFLSKKTRGVDPDVQKKNSSSWKFRKLAFLSVVGLTGSEDWESGQYH